jgi:hypothetical protein
MKLKVNIKYNINMNIKLKFIKLIGKPVNKCFYILDNNVRHFKINVYS